jgi:hypothetical protein
MLAVGTVNVARGVKKAAHSAKAAVVRVMQHQK